MNSTRMYSLLGVAALVFMASCTQPLSTREKGALTGGALGGVTGGLVGDQLQQRDQVAAKQQRVIEQQ